MVNLNWHRRSKKPADGQRVVIVVRGYDSHSGTKMDRLDIGYYSKAANNSGDYVLCSDRYRWWDSVLAWTEDRKPFGKICDVEGKKDEEDEC